VIPGGRFRPASTGVPAARGGTDSRANVDGEWMRNGTGRVDVRGFRELRI
jgi:hypothetical protein